MWYPEPWEVVPLRASGLGDMATLADARPSPSFGLHVPYALVYILAWFSGAASTTDADMTINQRLTDAEATFWDKPRKVMQDAGVTNTFFDMRIQADELYHWGFHPDIKIVPVWANPESGVIRWALEVGVAPLPHEGVR